MKKSVWKGAVVHVGLPHRRRTFRGFGSNALRTLVALAGCVSLMTGACFFGGDGGDNEEEPTPSPAPGLQRSVSSPAPRSTAMPTNTPEPPVGPIRVTYTLPFVWPASGPITSVMGPEHPSGIDIGLDAGGPLNVRASARGIVTQAGGSDDDGLGLSIVIDHGNGITTTYGHMSQLLVSAGDAVETGQNIGVGGATGNASGLHLHFEVRKDGQTVDPMDVLSSSSPDNLTQEFDCRFATLTLPAGSIARLDFAGLLGPGERVVGANASNDAQGTGLRGAVEGSAQVAFNTTLDFDGPERLEEHVFDFTIDNPAGNRTLTCTIMVQHRIVPTTFYARAASASDHSESEDVAGGGTPGTEPTAVPTPTSSAEPHYDSPVVANPTVGAPEYAAPGSAGPAVQQPSVGSPAGAAP